MKQIITKHLIFFVSFLFFAQSVYAQSPTDKVKEKVDAVIQVIVEAKKSNTLTETVTEDKLWVLVDAIFDFEILSQKSLGKNWLAMNDTEKKEFVSLFRKLLGRSYLNKIKGYDNENVQYVKEVFASPDNAEVFTKIQSKGQQYGLNYRLTQKNGEWKVYDVSIEGASLLSNYRSQFTDFLKKKTMQELLVNLQKKVDGKSPAKGS